MGGSSDTYDHRIATPSTSSLAVRATPFAFVLIWATGFVVAKYAVPYAEPLSFLVLRYIGVVVLMLALAVVARAPWPDRRAALHLAIAGAGIQAGYLGGVWAAIGAGMPAGVAALVVNLQPVLTGLWTGLFGKRLTARQGAGLLLGFAGVVLVVSSKLTARGITPLTLGLTTLALLSITSGTLYQSRFCPHFDLRTGQVVQFVSAIAVTLPFVLVFESFRVHWTPQLIGALAWSVLALTGGAISLLFLDAAPRRRRPGDKLLLPCAGDHRADGMDRVPGDTRAPSGGRDADQHHRRRHGDAASPVATLPPQRHQRD